MRLDREQRSILKRMLLGASISVLALGSVWFLPGLGERTELYERLVFVAQFELAILAWLAFSIAALAKHRFFVAEDRDPLGPAAGSDRARTLQATLTNTLEQTVLAIATHSLFIVLMSPKWASAIPVAVLLFLVGRVLFAYSYTKGATARALGFALTFYPSVLLLVACAVQLARDPCCM